MDKGLISIKSSFDVTTSIDRLETLMKQKGMTIFLRMNQSLNAKNIGLQLRPMELLIFGNPKIGTVLMQDNQTVAIDLPMKVLAWESENGDTILTYNDPIELNERHDLSDESYEVTSMMANMLKIVLSQVSDVNFMLN
jgi:uncharacterized protein (DUF302 family)